MWMPLTRIERENVDDDDGNIGALTKGNGDGYIFLSGGDERAGAGR